MKMRHTGLVQLIRNTRASKLVNFLTVRREHLKRFLKTTARPPPWPRSLGELKYLKFGRHSSKSWQHSPSFSQVSVMKKKSNFWEKMNSFKTNVLLQRNLTYNRPNMIEGTSTSGMFRSGIPTFGLIRLKCVLNTGLWHLCGLLLFITGWLKRLFE